MHRAMILVVALFAVAQANGYAMQPGPGCGPANYVFDGNKTKTGHVLAALMNFTSFPTQLGAISSGTSGCEPSRGVQRERDLEELVAIGEAALEQDIANGSGPYLQALSVLMGCPASAQDDFALWAQQRYAQGAGDMGSLKVFVLQMNADVASNEHLSVLCRVG